MSEFESTPQGRPEDGIYKQKAYQYLPPPAEGSVLDLTVKEHVKLLFHAVEIYQLDGKGRFDEYMHSQYREARKFGDIEWSEFTQAIWGYFTDNPLIGKYLLYLKSNNVPYTGYCQTKGLLSYEDWIKRQKEKAAAEERVRYSVPEDMIPDLQTQGGLNKRPRYASEVPDILGDDTPSRKQMPS